MRLPSTSAPLAVLATAAALAAPAAAQDSLLFTGRFPFVSLDAPNERPNGAINRLEEFDFSFVTPGASAFARSLQPATTHQAYLGDADNDGNYTKFAGLKTYFENLQFGGVFVKYADRTGVTADRVYFTVRDNVTQDIEAFTTNGTAVHVLRPGDFVRMTGNGNLEFFVTADQLDVAAGPPSPTGTSVKGASSMCQDAAGNLYYSPPTGGHWVNGNQNPPIFANDGSIVMIDAAAITYDPVTGNVVSIAPNSARLVHEEVNQGPGPSSYSVRQMVTNAGAFDRTGAALQVTGIFGKVSGLGLDPAGTMSPPSYPDASGAFPLVPDFVFASDAGSYAGTIFSTAGGGSIATINGILCGSATLGVPADGSWLGVQLDVANFQPSLMGMTVVDQIGYEPLVLDTGGFGAVQQAPGQATIDLDLHGIPGSLTFVLAQIGPLAPGGFPLSVPSALLGLPLAAGSHPQVFVAAPPTSLGFVVLDANGYATLSLNNFHTGAFTGATILVQSAALVTPDIQISNPVLLQLK